MSCHWLPAQLHIFNFLNFTATTKRNATFLLFVECKQQQQYGGHANFFFISFTAITALPIESGL
jgi:hypothetical protein